MIVLFAAKDGGRFSTLAASFNSRREIEVVSATTGEAALAELKSKRIDLVIADEHLGDMDGITLVKGLVKINPLVNTAIVSALTDDEFHEATEGLGVLMKLPGQPQEKDGEALLAVLEKIGALLQPQKVQKP